MNSRFKIIAAYLFAVPLALILGFLSTSPDEMTAMLLGILLFCLALPLLIRWHHTLLILFWNSVFCFFFLPGQPNFWLIMAGLSFAISFLNYILGHRPFINVPAITKPLIMLVCVVVATAFYRGGVGLKALGGAAHGGKYYIYVLGSVVGYFALTGGSIALEKARRTAGLFFISGASAVLSNIAYALGPAFYFAFYLVPSGFATSQAAADYGLTEVDRISGLGECCICVLGFLLVRYGLAGLLKFTRPWRVVFLITVLGACLFAGYRSVFILLILILAFQFYFEGLFRTKLFPITIGLGVCGFACIVLYSKQMPASVQRSISFLPVEVDSAIRSDAVGSTDWRMQMWKIVWKDVPHYLWVGKGYSIDPTEMYLIKEGIHMGLLPSYEEALLAGDYHSGPLSILIPFGIPGTIAFLWLLVAGYRLLYGNFRFGDAHLRTVNTALLCSYCAHVFAYFFIFGAFNSELSTFLGLLGVSVSINRGFRKAASVAQVEVQTPSSRAFAIEIG